jgi:hypothetical protein
VTASLLALALAYVFLLFLVLLAIFRSEIGAGLKLVLAFLCLGFYLWHYNSLQDYLGWPAADGIPPNFELISTIVVEPNLKNDEAGAIYIWVRDLDRDQLVPRSFRLPYQKLLHQQVDDTMHRQQQGERFVGKPRAGGSGKKSKIEFESIQRDIKSLKSSVDQEESG